MQSIRCGLLLHMQRVMPLSRLVTIVSRTKRLNRLRCCLGCQHAMAENYVYIGCSDVTQFMATMRSPFCGYNTTSCVELNGEYLSCYSNEIESVSLGKCPYDRRLTNKRYHNDKHFSEFYLQDGGKNQLA